MAVGKDASHQVRMSPGSLPSDEKSRRHLESVKHIEELRSERGIRPIVKGERHPPGRRIKGVPDTRDMDDGAGHGDPEAGVDVLTPSTADARAIHGVRR